MFIKGECTGNAAASPDWRSAVYQRKETGGWLCLHCYNRVLGAKRTHEMATVVVEEFCCYRSNVLK